MILRKTIKMVPFHLKKTIIKNDTDSFLMIEGRAYLWAEKGNRYPGIIYVEANLDVINRVWRKK